MRIAVKGKLNEKNLRKALNEMLLRHWEIKIDILANICNNFSDKKDIKFYGKIWLHKDKIIFTLEDRGDIEVILFNTMDDFVNYVEKEGVTCYNCIDIDDFVEKIMTTIKDYTDIDVNKTYKIV